MALVLRAFPPGIGIDEVDLSAPLLHLGKILELRAVVCSDGLEYPAELIAVIGSKTVHGLHDRFTGLAGDAHGNVVIGDSFKLGEHNRLACAIILAVHSD